MAVVIRNLVEGIGVANSLPINPKYFNEISIPETLTIPCQKPDMEQLLSVMVDIEVVSIRVVETPIALSYEGQNLSGCKLIVELKLKEKVKYVADEPTQTVHAAHYENIFKSVFIIIPSEIDGKLARDYLRKRKISVVPYIEDIYSEMLDKRRIYKNITVLVDVNFMK